MALVTTVNPLNTINTLNRWMEKEFAELGQTAGSFGPEPRHPAVDILEDETAFTIVMELPGVAEDAIDMKIEKQLLTVKGERPKGVSKEGQRLRRRERIGGPFERSFRVPDFVDAEAITADLKRGVLTIALPKKEETRPRTIKVDMKSK